MMPTLEAARETLAGHRGWANGLPPGAWVGPVDGQQLTAAIDVVLAAIAAQAMEVERLRAARPVSERAVDVVDGSGRKIGTATVDGVTVTGRITDEHAAAMLRASTGPRGVSVGYRVEVEPEPAAPSKPFVPLPLPTPQTAGVARFNGVEVTTREQAIALFGRGNPLANTPLPFVMIDGGRRGPATPAPSNHDNVCACGRSRTAGVHAAMALNGHAFEARPPDRCRDCGAGLPLSVGRLGCPECQPDPIEPVRQPLWQAIARGTLIAQSPGETDEQFRERVLLWRREIGADPKP